MLLAEYFINFVNDNNKFARSITSSDIFSFFNFMIFSKLIYGSSIAM